VKNDGALGITQNPVLADLRGLGALEAANRLTVSDKRTLPTCEAGRLRDRLAAASLELVEIKGNDDAGVCP